MTQEEKELLLKDLCARLPYGVVCSIYGDNSNGVKLCGIKSNKCYFEDLDYKEGDGYVSIEGIKPYLRPMSSMDSEEIETYRALIGSLLENSVTDNVATLYNFLNSKHLDYRGMIHMGLALEAPEGMYVIE